MIKVASTAMAHTHGGPCWGESRASCESARLPLATRSNDIPPDKSILLPAPHAPHAPHVLPCAPGGGTDVSCSQYRHPSVMSNTLSHLICATPFSRETGKDQRRSLAR